MNRIFINKNTSIIAYHKERKCAYQVLDVYLFNQEINALVDESRGNQETFKFDDVIIFIKPEEMISLKDLGIEHLNFCRICGYFALPDRNICKNCDGKAIAF